MAYTIHLDPQLSGISSLIRTSPVTLMRSISNVVFEPTIAFHACVSRMFFTTCSIVLAIDRISGAIHAQAVVE